ncbi:MAG: hypothetical protein ING69_02590 [Rhodocyclaceae bacterium]|nr:hypothetical protein [Rhodocyclaceae bacterium]
MVNTNPVPVVAELVVPEERLLRRFKLAKQKLQLADSPGKSVALIDDGWHSW